jgi:hypothetical protein
MVVKMLNRIFHLNRKDSISKAVDDIIDEIYAIKIIIK